MNEPISRRRRLSFSLGVAFVCLSVLSVPLAWRAMEIRRASKERAALIASIGQTPHVVSGEERKVYEALDARSDFKFKDTTLRAVANQLAAKYGIRIEIEELALDQAGLGADVPVTFQQKAVTLREALTEILKPLELTHYVYTSIGSPVAVIHITTPERAVERSVSRVYNVSDLLGESGTAAELAVALRNGLGEPRKITSSSSDVPATPRRIGAFRNLLIVYATEREHREVAELLEKVRLGLMASEASK
jgi:type II secretory pathway component GspD/PulD (secretin)